MFKKGDRVMDVDGGPVGTVKSVTKKRVRVFFGDDDEASCDPAGLVHVPGHQTWEYYSVSADAPRDALVDKCNTLGSKGWELVTCAHNNLLFKRKT